MHNKFMQLAIDESKKSSERGPCGAVIVKDGKVIAAAHNDAESRLDISGHAEINAMKIAAKKLGTRRLEGCEIYCSCEPCTMCLSAIYFARIRKIYFHLTLNELFPDDRFIGISIDDFLAKFPEKTDVQKI